MAEWTRERPTEAGIYWLWEEGYTKAQAVEVWFWTGAQWQPEILTMGVEAGIKLSAIEGYWLGPLEVPQPPTDKEGQHD